MLSIISTCDGHTNLTNNFSLLIPFTDYLPTAPTAPPSNIQVGISSNQVTVSWSPPPEGTHGGVLTEYTICFLQDNEDTCSVERTISATSVPLSHVEDSLLSETNYRLRICASTAAGVGPCSSNISLTTGTYVVLFRVVCYFLLFYHEGFIH